VRGREQFGGCGQARASVQTAQQASADGADRGGQAGATLEPGVGAGLRQRARERESESRHAGGGAQVSGVFAGGGPRRAAVRDPRPGGDGRLKKRS